MSTELKGGKGSGNFGHEGRPGKQGGSGSGKGGGLEAPSRDAFLSKPKPGLDAQPGFGGKTPLPDGWIRERVNAATTTLDTHNGKYNLRVEYYNGHFAAVYTKPQAQGAMVNEGGKLVEWDKLSEHLDKLARGFPISNKSMKSIFDEKLAAIKGGPGSGRYPKGSGDEDSNRTSASNAYRLPSIEGMRQFLEKEGISTSNISKKRTLLEQRTMLSQLLDKYGLYHNWLVLSEKTANKSISFKSLAESIEERVDELKSQTDLASSIAQLEVVLEMAMKGGPGSGRYPKGSGGASDIISPSSYDVRQVLLSEMLGVSEKDLGNAALSVEKIATGFTWRYSDSMTEDFGTAKMDSDGKILVVTTNPDSSSYDDNEKPIRLPLKSINNLEMAEHAASFRRALQLLREGKSLPDDLAIRVDDAMKSYLKGGRGSGNFGHEGRPGKVGGSGSGRMLGAGMSAEALAADTEQSDREYIRQHQKDEGNVANRKDTSIADTKQAIADSSTMSGTYSDDETWLSHSAKDDTYTIRDGFYYTHGKTSQDHADRVSKELTESGIKHEITNHGEKNYGAPFRGGDKVRQGPHWYVTIKIPKS